MKRVLFIALALFSFAAFISCSNAAGGSDSANVQTGAASSSKKSGVVTLTGTVSVSGAVPQILSDNYDASSDGGTSRSAQPGLDVSGESATMEYFATATCDGVVKNGVFGSGADAKKFGLELEAEKNWSIVVGVRDKTDPEKIYLESPAWGVTPDAADPTISHNFVPVPTTSGGKGNIKLKVEFNYLSYTVRANFISGPSGVDLTALTLTQENDSAGKILTCDNVDSGVYEISIDFVTTTSKPILEYSTIQTVTVAKNMTTNAWARDGNESAASPISGGKFQFNSGNKDALIKEFLGSNIYVDNGDGVDSSDTYSGNWKSPLKSVNAAVQKIKATGDAGATAKDYVIHCSGTFNSSSYASTPSLTSASITSTNSKSITIVGTSASGADTFSASDAGVSAFFVDTTVPVKFKNITLRGASGIGNSYLAALDVKGGAQVTIEDNVTITGSKIGVSVDGATTSVKLNGGTIKNNTTAVQVKNGSFVVQKGSIPFNSAVCSNDVKLDENKFITVKGDLSEVDVSTAKIGITPGQRKRGVKVVDTAASTATVADVKGKFLIADPTVSDTNPDGDEWEVVAAAADNALKTNAPIYVGQAPDGTAGSNDNAGTKSAPYAAIMRACQDMNDASMPYTINVKGTVSGSQTVSAMLSKTAGDGKSYHAASVLIKGVTPIPTSGAQKDIPQDSIDGGGASASALNIYPDVPVTIQNLKITKGGGSFGGGINMSSGTDVTIKSGTLITANEASQRGGGIYCKDGTLKIEGGKIYANKITGTSSGYGGVGLYAESSSDKSAVITMTGGEISGNKCESANVNGGGVKLNGANVSFNMSGGAVKDNESLNLGANFYVNESDITLSGTAEISGGKIETTANDAIGAAMWLEGSSASLTMTGGKICGNTAKTTKSGKNANAGVYVKASTFTMSGGEISGNQILAGNKLGGAVRLSPDEGSAFVMKGTAFVPYGGTEGDNDVCLHDKKSITLADGLSKHSNADGKRVGVMVAGWKRGSAILGVSGSYSITDEVQKKFVLTAPATDEWEKILATNQKSVTINAPIYVGKKPDGTNGNDSNSGARSTPFATIARACQEMNDASTEYIININGSVSGAQEIPDTLLKTAGSDTTKYYAKSVTLMGVADSGAKIDRGLASATAAASDGTALKVNSTVPIVIKGLSLTGGYASSGGGLYLASESNVTLGDGTAAGAVTITSNKAESSGAGIYAAGASGKRATLVINDKVEISSNSIAKASDSAQWGGIGIFAQYTDITMNGGTVKSHDGTTVATPSGSHPKGAGFYLNYATLNVNGGKITGNKTGEQGANIYSIYSDVTIDGGEVSSGTLSSTATNIVVAGAGIFLSGAVTGGGGLLFKSGKITENTASSANGYARGAGIYTYLCPVTVENSGITDNTASGKYIEGGAVSLNGGSNVYATLELKGAAYIPYGSAVGKNDVFLAQSSTVSGGTKTQYSAKVKVNGTLSQSTTAATLQPQLYERGMLVAEGTSSQYSKLKLPTDFSSFKVDATTGKIVLANIVKDIYIKSTGTDPSGDMTADITWKGCNASTEYKSFKTIKTAAQFITWQDSGTTDYTIYIDGSLSGLQRLTNEDSTTTAPINLIKSSSKTTAKSIKICGTSDSAQLFGNVGNTATANGVTLYIKTSKVPVTVSRLIINGGNHAGNGGGIYADLGGALNDVEANIMLTLGDGTNPLKIYTNKAIKGGGVYCHEHTSLTIKDKVKIYGNQALKDGDTTGTGMGGGIFVYSGNIYMTGGDIYDNTAQAYGGGIGTQTATLFVSGNACIGKRDVSGTYAATADSDKHSNIADYGGGAYVNVFYLGYTGLDANGNPVAETDTSKTCMVNYNYAKNEGDYAYGGGGIASPAGKSYVSSRAKIMNNAAAKAGGGIYKANTALVLEGGTIQYNKAVTNGGAICIGTGSKAELQMKGNIYIPGGCDGLSLSHKCNDVYLSSNKKINIIGNLSQSTVAYITPISNSNILNKQMIASGDGFTGSLPSAVSKFKLSDASINSGRLIDGAGYYRSGTTATMSTIQNRIANAADGDMIVLTGSLNVNNIASIASYVKAKSGNIALDFSSATISSTIALSDANSFKDCTNLTEIVMDGSKMKPGSYGFSGCAALTAIRFVNSCDMTSWGYTTSFINCSNLATMDCTGCSTVKLNGGINMGRSYYTKLDTIMLGSSLTTLGMGNMDSFDVDGFKLTYAGMAADFDKANGGKITTTRLYGANNVTVSCKCANNGSSKTITWSESTNAWSF